MAEIKKRWSSLQDLSKDLKNKKVDLPVGYHAKSADSQIDLTRIIDSAREAKSSKDLFDTTCLLSKFFEKKEKIDLSRDVARTNLYISLLYAVFQNKKFNADLAKLVIAGKELFGEKSDTSNVEEKVFVNTAISLAFLPLAEIFDNLKETNILFFRKQLVRLMREHLKATDYIINFAQLAFKLERIIWNRAYHFNNNYRADFPITLDDGRLFANLKVARALAGISLLSSVINISLEEQVKAIIAKMADVDFSISRAFSNLFGVIYRIEEGVKSYCESVPQDKVQFAEDFFESYIRNNEKNSIFFIKKICSDFYYQPEKKFYEIVLEKIESARSLKKEIIEFGQTHLSAFKGVVAEDDVDWSNKLFLISVKTLSSLEEIQPAKDKKWAVSAAVFELKEWLKNVHGVLNKYFIEDEWHLISRYLKQEDVEVEWKSSFFTPLEQESVSPEADSALGKKLFERIVRTVLGMLNSAGGVIIVGLVENPGAVVRMNIAEGLISKNGKYFFDVGSELKRANRSFDYVRLQICDQLRSITGVTAEKFNDLFILEPIFLSSRDTGITIAKITIKKAEKFFVSVDKRSGGNIWVSLVKRANGQTIDVDIRDYI